MTDITPALAVLAASRSLGPEPRIGVLVAGVLGAALCCAGCLVALLQCGCG